MPNLSVNDVRMFVPARDFALSKRFYAELGWQQIRGDQHLAVMEIDDQRFYLQNYYAKDWAENFMIHLSVDDASAWATHVQAMVDTNLFPNVRVRQPRAEDYGALVTYVWDPSGVLLHCAQWTDG